MALLDQLGINITTVYLFVIFTVAFIGLRFMVFQPYFDALAEREKRTKGGEELAKDLLVKATDLQSKYEDRARSISTEIKNIFDAEKSAAAAVYEKTVTAAKIETEKQVEEMKKKISETVKTASEQMKSETPNVAAAITQKMLN
jgi:F-type H+-transporting ATPase subunit b